jgi:hypothetical protein
MSFFLFYLICHVPVFAVLYTHALACRVYQSAWADDMRDRLFADKVFDGNPYRKG